MAFGVVLEVASLAVTAIGAGLSYYASEQALSQQEEMIQTQQLNNRYKTLVRKNKTLDQMQLQLQRNEAHNAVSGVRSNSPSFFAVQADTIEQGDKALRNADTAEALKNYSLQMQRREAETQASLNRIKIITSAVSSALNVYNSSQQRSQREQ